ncbi:MAG: glycoside hydrolase family 3 C-terminal domain-containing protein [Solirubrobacterales bacterium]|nr:glycoside hydrolase family 3 C-terminal domain-containing protein [Solirubrobacterales bacterium]
MFALRRRRVMAVLAVAGLTLLAASGTSAGAPAPPWQNPNQPPLTRADELLAAMSTDQKIDLALGQFAPLQSLGIPALSSDDGPDGLRNPGTTAMPSGQDLAAGFNRALARAYGEVVGSEARGEGFNEWLGPAVDNARTPLAGRQPEAEGEDPFLAGNTSAQVILGAQSQHVISTLKHYTAYNQDYGRIGFAAVGAPAVNVQVSERALQEIYETPFRIAVQQGGVDSVMCSYNQINGLPSCENPTTLADLKQGDGLGGFVVPDFGFAVRDAVPAANAGVDLAALPGAPSSLTAADFTSGQISAARLDDMVRRILYAMFDSGVFDNPLPATPATEVSTPQHQLVATQVAEAGTVLLKNDRAALPLSPRHVHSIALIGPTGNDAVFVSGGSAGVPLAANQAITPAQGISARAAQSGMNVTTVQGSAGDQASPTLVDPAVLTPSSGTGPGLLGQYWSNGSFTGAPAVTEVDQHIDATGPPISPAPAVWSARWTGTLTPTESGLYRFTLSEAGIATLKIAGQTFGPAYREATQFIVGPHYVVNGAVQLIAGQSVPVEIDYLSASGLFSHEIHFGWQTPSQSGIPAAVAAARQADVAIVFANDAQGEGMDRYSLSLPGDQNQLIDAVAHANRHTVVVLNTGGPVLMPWLGEVSSVLEAWYPGQQFGAAIAAVLFGDANPGGRLPVTFPATQSQGPAAASPPSSYPGDANGNESYAEGLDVGYRWYDATGQRPLFPFGYGLSYESFRVSGLHAFYNPFAGTAFVFARVTNTSWRSGPTTVELFVHSPAAAQEPPKQLKGYTNVTLGPGQTKFVVFRLTPSDLAYFNTAAGRWTVAPGRYTVLLGTSSTELDHAASFDVGHFGHRR